MLQVLIRKKEKGFGVWLDLVTPEDVRHQIYISSDRELMRINAVCFTVTKPQITKLIKFLRELIV